MYGEYLKAARLRNQLSVADLAGRVGVSADAIYKMERNVTKPELTTLDRIAGAMGVLIGDLLPNSGGASSGHPFEPIEAALSGLDEEEQTEQILLLANQARLVRNAIVRRRPVAQPINVVPFAQPERTEPRWTEDFPVHPERFIDRDFDYPRELHALEVDEFEVAAGATGVASELDDMAFTLNTKDVRDATHRVIKVHGDSMVPDYEEGWKLLVDLKKKDPKPGDPVAVYLENEGGVLGYWEPTKGGITLEKANPSYKPLKLGDPTTWRLIGTVQKIVEAPAKKRGGKK